MVEPVEDLQIVGHSCVFRCRSADRLESGQDSGERNHNQNCGSGNELRRSGNLDDLRQTGPLLCGGEQRKRRCHSTGDDKPDPDERMKGDAQSGEEAGTNPASVKQAGHSKKGKSVREDFSFDSADKPLAGQVSDRRQQQKQPRCWKRRFDFSCRTATQRSPAEGEHQVAQQPTDHCRFLKRNDRRQRTDRLIINPVGVG